MILLYYTIFLISGTSRCTLIKQYVPFSTLKIIRQMSILKYTPKRPYYLRSTAKIFTLDRTLSYKQLLENTANKLRKQNGIIKKLAGISGEHPQTCYEYHLLLSALALLNTAHLSGYTQNIDTLLNETRRTVSGTIKSTITPRLTIMSAKIFAEKRPPKSN